MMIGIRSRLRQMLRHARWNIGVARISRETFLSSPEFRVFSWYGHTKPDEFVADPFLIDHDRGMHVFYEQYSFMRNRGEIWVSPISEKGTILPGHPVLNPNYHLSYPFLLRHEGELYMIPESFERGEIAIYRCTDFPYEWKRVKALMPEVPGLDATVFQHEGLWWMMAMPFTEPQTYALHLWYADDLFGAWTPHPMNPVVEGSDRTRPAGAIFRQGESIYRPAQDCSKVYGGKLVINSITELTPDRYMEQHVQTIAPDKHAPYRNGVHTINACGEFLTIDACAETFVPSEATRIARAWLAGRG